MENHTLLLHIGMPKTGTSALQKFLYDNREHLKECGWLYPDLKSVIGETESNFIEYMNASVLYKVGNELDIQAENWVLSWDYLKKELENYNVILSSELIFTVDAVAFLNEVIKEYYNVKVIIYLRRQDIFLESYWAQVVKVDGYVKNFKDSMQEFMRYTHYLDLLYSISDIIGKENLIVRVYEKEQYEGNKNDIVREFLDTIGIHLDCVESREKSMVNQSLYGNYLEIRRIFNTLKVVDTDFLNNYRKYFLKLSSLLPKEKKIAGYFVDEEERKQFLDSFKEENRIIAEQFMGNKEGILFRDMDTDIPSTGVTVSEFEEDLIRLFGLIVCSEVKALRQRIDLLEKNSMQTTEMLIDLKKSDRKLVYFGAGEKCRELLKRYSLDVTMILDNDREKTRCQVGGIPIVSPADIHDWKELFVIITCRDPKEIEKQLGAIGLSKNKDYILAHEFMY